ncbi:hypothetical protein KY289_019601 [Solanum tuberosum]|nr:hypothetical protein KY289_019601 [Solanum tuberosum]
MTMRVITKATLTAARCTASPGAAGRSCCWCHRSEQKRGKKRGGARQRERKKVINNVKASDIKIVEGGSTRKAKDSDSEEVVSPSLDQDKYKEHQ